jgi:hypothetical protein
LHLDEDKDGEEGNREGEEDDSYGFGPGYIASARRAKTAVTRLKAPRKSIFLSLESQWKCSTLRISRTKNTTRDATIVIGGWIKNAL